MSLTESNIKYLAGVGEKRANALRDDFGIVTYEDMLKMYPYKYIDRTKIYSISELSESSAYIQIKARIHKLQALGQGSGRRISAKAFDSTGEIELVWFKGLKYIPTTIHEGVEYLIFGQVSSFNHKFNIVHPEINPYDTASQLMVGFQAIYTITDKMKKSFLNSKAISKIMLEIFNSMKNEKINETLRSELIENEGLINLHQAVYNIHFPESYAMLEKARYRLKFEELFYIQLNNLRSKYERKANFYGCKFPIVGDYFNDFYKNHLPFSLTEAQKKVIKEIRQDCYSGRQMNRLLQGDVGSGKTLVAVMCMLIALDNGYQACIMAPTEILASQHMETITEMLSGMNINIALLTGSTKKKDRVILHENLENGTTQILIGTHALIEENVKFSNLGLVVIDEQHRFGVAQRAKLWKKNDTPPHILVMTATPIPRTLAMVAYSDLDISIINELPPGRKPIKTMHTFESNRAKVYDFIAKELNNRHQAYIVYPMIYESEKTDYQTIEKGFDEICNYFEPLNFKVGLVHGKMKAADKEAEMQKFVQHHTDILVATTVIEVGVNIPNASVMLIESAERFGLSQLHQLRGRVGRGSDASYCILMTSYKLSSDSRSRIETMTSTNDGFEIAEADLRLRGPGDIEGTQQSGLACNLKIANILKDEPILKRAAQAVENILKDDATLSNPKNNIYVYWLKKMFNVLVWRYIS